MNTLNNLKSVSKKQNNIVKQMTKDKQLQILQQPDTFLRQPTQDIDLPISSDNEENNMRFINCLKSYIVSIEIETC